MQKIKVVYSKMNTVYGNARDWYYTSPARRMLQWLLILLAAGALTAMVIIVAASGKDGILQAHRALLYCAVLLIAALVMILMVRNAKLEYIFLAAGIGIGMLYLFVITPFSVADEFHHYEVSYKLSGYLIGQADETTVKASHFDYSGLAVHENAVSAYLRLIDEGIYRDTGNIYVELTQTPTIYYFAQNLPQAIGMAIARLLQLNFFGIFYLGRVMNLLFYVLCVFFAIRAVRDFKLPLLLVAILPVSLQQAGSLSHDAFVNGITMLLIAYMIRAMYERDKPSWGDIAVIAIAAALLVPSKPVYFPVILLALLIFPAKFGWKKAKGYLLALGVIVLGLLTTALFQFQTVDTLTDASPNTGFFGLPTYTLSFIFEHPIDTINIFINTIRESFIWYALTPFGWCMTGGVLMVPLQFVVVFVFVVFMSVLFHEKDSWMPTLPQRGWYLLVCVGTVFAVMLSMFLFETPDSYDTIVGIHGRYFIPLLPLVLLIVRSKLRIGLRPYCNGLILFAAAAHVLVLRHILFLTIG